MAEKLKIAITFLYNFLFLDMYSQLFYVLSENIQFVGLWKKFFVLDVCTETQAPFVTEIKFFFVCASILFSAT